MKTDHFPFCGHCSDFQNAGILTEGLLTASTFRIWNSSTGIPSPPLALFILMLPKVNWTSHSRMSSYRCDHTIVVIWVIENFLIQFLHVFLSPLLNIFCFCWVHNFFFPLVCPSCMKCSLHVSNFLEEISSLSHSVDFLYFFPLFT